MLQKVTQKRGFVEIFREDILLRLHTSGDWNTSVAGLPPAMGITRLFA